MLKRGFGSLLVYALPVFAFLVLYWLSGSDITAMFGLIWSWVVAIVRFVAGILGGIFRGVAPFVA